MSNLAQNDLNFFRNTSSKVLVSQLIGWSWLEAYYALQVVLQLNALPLFVQITQIVGGVLVCFTVYEYIRCIITVSNFAWWPIGT